MSRGSTPTLHCDAEDGCPNWETDWYAASATLVNGIRVTATRRAPGWSNSDDDDRCPEHAPRQGRCIGCRHPSGSECGGCGTFVNDGWNGALK